MKDIIKRGGDTNTNAAIVGGLIGAAYGFDPEKGIKEEWLKKIREFDTSKSG